MQFKTLFKHPKGLWSLAFGQMCDTFSYYGTQTILTLYFIHIFHLSRQDSYLLYGTYAAFAYVLPIFGGIVADKWLSSRKTLIIGNCLNILGNLLLMSFQHSVFCLGMATSLVGAGLYKSTSAHLIGELYPKGDIRKETGFTWLYLSVNVGGTLGPLIYGLIAHAIGWNFGFLCSALGIFIATLWILKNGQLTPSQSQLFSAQHLLLYFGIFCVILLLSLLFYFPRALNPLVLITFLTGLMYLFIAIKKYKNPFRNHLLALIIIGFFSMFYFIAGLQTGITVTLFIQQKIHQGLLITQFPASIFSTFYPLFVLVLAPCFTYVWARLKLQKVNIHIGTKLIISVLLAALGIAIFAIATTSKTNLVFIYILLGYLVLSAGEVVLMPAAYTAISDLSPIPMKSTMMGSFFLFVGLGGYISSVVANAAHFVVSINFLHLNELPAFSGEFLLISTFTLLVGILLIIFMPILTKLMNN